MLEKIEARSGVAYLSRAPFVFSPVCEFTLTYVHISAWLPIPLALAFGQNQILQRSTYRGHFFIFQKMCFSLKTIPLKFHWIQLPEGQNCSSGWLRTIAILGEYSIAVF